MATRAKTSASAKLLAGVVPSDAVGIFGCAPTPLSADLPAPAMPLVARSRSGVFQV